MAVSNLLALIDDIATVLDDVAVISKVAAKKTAGVLGDDLALNAQQVSGVKAERELPVVWAVAKGSFLNKLILVPSALLISAIYSPLIIVLLIIGGLYLCYEGFEKVFHKLFHREEEEAEQAALIKALSDPNADLVAFENKKIKGAIRTDFILSAEIIVIVLGTAQAQPLMQQIIVLSTLAIAFTVGVYGLVAGIVKLDDAGLALLNRANEKGSKGLQYSLGKGLLLFAPFLMKSLSVIGTVAMFLVGGGILMHDIGFLHHMQEWLMAMIADSTTVDLLVPMLLSLVVGFIAGGLMMPVAAVGGKLVGLFKR
ncbi:MAG: DUF808 domain-containing protein [Aestuariibacter sp.]